MNVLGAETAAMETVCCDTGPETPPAGSAASLGKMGAGGEGNWRIQMGDRSRTKKFSSSIG